MTTLKVTFNGETRRLRDVRNYNELLVTTKNLFVIDNEHKGVTIVFTWYDSDGDEITMSSQPEFDDAMEETAGKLRLTLVLKNDTVPSRAGTETHSSKNDKEEAFVFEHSGVQCDGCGVLPIRGERWKCTERHDYDLCAGCKVKDETGCKMVEIKPGHYHARDAYRNVPFGGRRCGRRKNKCERLKTVISETANEVVKDVLRTFNIKKPVVKVKTFTTTGSKIFEGTDTALSSSSETENDNGANGKRDPFEKEPDDLVDIIHESVNQALDDAVSEVVEESIYMNKDNMKDKLSMSFVRDITFPDDGQSIPPGTKFQKVWRVANTGAIDWPEGVKLVGDSGHNLSSSILLLNPLKAGEKDDIEIALTAPEIPGHYTQTFRAQTSNNEQFGQRLWASITVLEEEWQVVKDVKESDETASCDSSSAQKFEEQKQQQEQQQQQQQQQKEEQDDPLRNFQKELNVLREMGFTNIESILPLLQQNLPFESTQNTPPDTQGLERVVASLVGSVLGNMNSRQ